MSSKSKYSRGGITPHTKGPPPRAAITVDCVMSRGGDMDIRRLYLGPGTMSVQDLVNMLSAISAVCINNSVRDVEDRKLAYGMFIEMMLDRVNLVGEVSDNDSTVESVEAEGSAEEGKKVADESEQ